MTSNYLRKIVSAQKNGQAVGITSVCSSNPFVLRSALEHARNVNQSMCIESTGRQVNQDGGYAEMAPKQFAQNLSQFAETLNLDSDQIILGGDHLGPGPWCSENASRAMDEARELVRQCVFAGYQKLHLDPSMPCRDDMRNGLAGLSIDTIAERTALLCEAAEEAAAENPNNKSPLLYVIGAEVPVPGGMSKDKNNICISSADTLEETIRIMHHAFTRRGLEDAWNRCIAVVVETGATFSPETVYDYDSTKTEAIKRFIRGEKHLVFEAHSTDFQTLEALKDMVRDHFAILKVGPNLSFAAREAIFALGFIEQQWIGKRKGVRLSHFPEVMGKLMHTDKTHWQKHYDGDTAYLQYITAFGFSDRIRYYWSHPGCTNAVDRLFANLTQHGIPLPLISQYLPDLFEAVREGRIQCTPEQLVYNKIKAILDKYTTACGIL